MIGRYFEKIERTISYFKNIQTCNLTKKFYNDRQGFISGIILFEDNSCLEFTEIKNTEFRQKIKYRYHYMDSQNNLIFRYDNAPHHKELKTFPHHKHLQNDTVSCNEVDIQDVLLEIRKYTLKN